MKHFRSLLSLGAIDDDDDCDIEPYELHRIRSQQLSKSTRLSQRKRQNKQRLESNTQRLSFRTIDGKKVRVIQPPLQHSYSTKLTRRQFSYPNIKKKKQQQQQQQNINKNNNEENKAIILSEERSFDEALELDTYEESENGLDFELNLDDFGHQSFDLQLPIDTFIPSPSPNNNYNNYNINTKSYITPFNEYFNKQFNNNNNNNNIKRPRLNTTLPAPPPPPITINSNDTNNNNNNNDIPPFLPPPTHHLHYQQAQRLIMNQNQNPNQHQIENQIQTQTPPKLNEMLPRPNIIDSNTINTPLNPPTYRPIPISSTISISNRSNRSMRSHRSSGNNHSNNHSNNKYGHGHIQSLYLNPENSIASIISSVPSESVPARISMNSWPSQNSILSPMMTNSSTQNRISSKKNSSVLSPIISSPISSKRTSIIIDNNNNNNIEIQNRLHSPHLNRINDTVLELTDTEDDPSILDNQNNDSNKTTQSKTPSSESGGMWHVSDEYQHLLHHNDSSPAPPIPTLPTLPTLPTRENNNNNNNNNLSNVDDKNDNNYLPRLATIVSQSSSLSINSPRVNPTLNQSLSKEIERFLPFKIKEEDIMKPQLTPNNTDPLSSKRTSRTITTNMTSASARTSTTLSSGLPDYSPNDSPHSLMHSDTDDIIYDHNHDNDNDKQPSPTNIDQFTMHLDNIGGDNSAAKIYEMHNEQMLSPPNMANHLERLTAISNLTGLNDINIEHALKHQHTMEVVTDSDDTELHHDSMHETDDDDDDDDDDVNNPFEYQSDNDDLNAFPPNELSLNLDASRHSEIFKYPSTAIMDQDNNENDNLFKMQPMSLAHTQNSNEIDIKIDFNGYRDSGDSQIVYQLIADTVSPNNKDMILKKNNNNNNHNNNNNKIEEKKDNNKDDDNGKIIFDENINKLIDNIFPSKDFIFMDNIGRGAYGVVDKSFHLKSCQIVAIKRSRSAKKEMINSFKKEILICNEFKDCKYIINMIASGTDKKKNEKCIALEYMNMGSLTTKQYYTMYEIQNICISVLNALNELHLKLYVHNDIKPDNILFNNNGDIVLTDFGCIKQMKDKYTPLTQPIGSFTFQSYEKKFLSPIKYTTKSDIYSFGITICEILNGSHITNKSYSNNDNDDNKKHDEDLIPYKIPQNVLNKYSNSNQLLMDFINKCLEKNYKKRWSAKQLLKHPFLLNKCMNDNNDNNNNNINNINNKSTDDLEFMTDTLIDYYLNYNKSRRASKIPTTQNCLNENNEIDKICLKNEKNNFFKDLSKTPIDDEYTDSQRIQNMAKYSGYSIDAVQDYIFQCVNDVKNKYLKR